MWLFASDCTTRQFVSWIRIWQLETMNCNVGTRLAFSYFIFSGYFIPVGFLGLSWNKQNTILSICAAKFQSIADRSFWPRVSFSFCFDTKGTVSLCFSFQYGILAWRSELSTATHWPHEHRGYFGREKGLRQRCIRFSDSVWPGKCNANWNFDEFFQISLMDFWL